MKSLLNNNNFIIEMSENEALVLYEYLFSNISQLRYEHYSEKKVLLQLQGAIETKLASLFSGQYLEKLNTARGEVQGNDEIEDKFWKKIL